MMCHASVVMSRGRQNLYLSYLCLTVHRYQGDLRWLGNHVRGEMSHHVDLSGILPRRDAGLMDKYQRVQSSIVAGLRGNGDVYDSVEDGER